MPKFVWMPPQNENKREWAARLSDTHPDYDVVTPETMEEAKKELVDADAAFGDMPKDALEVAGKLRWLQSPAAAPPAGYYYKELVEHPVTVTNFRGIYNDHISAHIMMMLLALSRGLPFYFRAQMNREWNKEAPKYSFVYLPESTAVIVGAGGIGSETARLCSQFGMEVIAVDPRVTEAPEGVSELHTPDRLDDVLPRADFLILTLPHTPESELMFHAGRFKKMKKTAYFINIGRGMTTRIDDLADAVESGTIAGAGLDVYETEPLPADHRLWGLENVILTPHVAAQDGAYLDERRINIILENARRFARGESLLNEVDKSLWF